MRKRFGKTRSWIIELGTSIQKGNKCGIPNCKNPAHILKLLKEVGVKANYSEMKVKSQDNSVKITGYLFFN